jgi:phosphoribosyl-ATP pyrophosphohydrolase/phosphoribosyl-AMP cyclohydrolase/histidinol dehydrogenase
VCLWLFHPLTFQVLTTGGVFAATYGYAKQYSGVNLASFVKHITSSNLTADGLRNVGEAVMQLAKVEELEAHRRAVSIRLEHMSK